LKKGEREIETHAPSFPSFTQLA
jgi:hypothetical protein